MSFRIILDAFYPEGGELTYSFSSPCGSFADQKSTEDGVEVIFVSGNLKSNDAIIVTLIADDSSGKNNVTEKEILIGFVKPFPVISVSPAAVIVNSGGTAAINLTADRTCSFQIICDDFAMSASDIRMNTSENVFGVETETGTDISTSAVIYGPTAAAGADMNHTVRITSTGTHKVWIAFQDSMGQTAVKLCTVTVN